MKTYGRLLSVLVTLLVDVLLMDLCKHFKQLGTQGEER